jgi:hypothetical protein
MSMADHASRRSFLERATLLSVVAARFPSSRTRRSRRSSAWAAPPAHLAERVLLSRAAQREHPGSRQGHRPVRVCDFCARQGFDAVDLTGYFFPGYPNAPDDRYLSRLKRHALALGLDISGTGVRNDFTAADRTVRDEGVRRIKTWIEVAAKLGAPVIRAFADSQPPFKNWREASGQASREAVETWMADCLRECAAHGETFGVVVGVQNHGDSSARAPSTCACSSAWGTTCAALVDTAST